MSDPKSRLSTRVQVFTRATADASNRAIGEVFDARSPWQLLYRLRRIVFLGLVLYLGWILVVVQPDLARRLMLPPTPRFQERFACTGIRWRRCCRRRWRPPALASTPCLWPNGMGQAASRCWRPKAAPPSCRWNLEMPGVNYVGGAPT